MYNPLEQSAPAFLRFLHQQGNVELGDSKYAKLLNGHTWTNDILLNGSIIGQFIMSFEEHEYVKPSSLTFKGRVPGYTNVLTNSGCVMLYCNNGFRVDAFKVIPFP